MAINAEICPVTNISKPEVDELFALFQTAFQASRRGFQKDLEEKDFLLRVRSDEGLQAFSTLKLYYPEPGVRLLFSGDTFSAETARSGHHLPTRWAQFVFAELPHQPGMEDYWLLLCSGYRTYRILPTFFKTYVPSADSHPRLKERLDRWAAQLFCERYQEGVVKPRWPTPLHFPEPPPRLEVDPHVRFFSQANPGYSQGDELACLIPLERANLRPGGQRLAQR
jgi:hypothetical protein